MDVKELRAEAALTERSNDGGVKFAVQYDRSKCEAGAGAFKADTAGARPCAVIGPDRVVLPARDAAKKPAEPWLVPDPGYRRLPDYPYKMSDHKDPSRNISPRQTFQENMQRIIMQPGYNATKLHEDPPFAPKNNKLNAPLEVKYCDVPYNINQVSSDQKHIHNSDHSASNVNPLLVRGLPHGWPAGSVHVRPLRTYGAPEVLHYPDYANCTGPRPVLTRTHTAARDEQLYPDAYYHESNIRFKPYPNLKERYPPTRYEYLGNYPNPYHPPNPFAHKYDLPKTIPPHSYSGYPQVPKYTERIPDPIMDGYQRTYSQQGSYGVPVRNPVIHSPYRPLAGNHMQNKLHPYPPDGQHKPIPNRLPYDPASKMYLDYDTRAKPITDNYYLNELPRSYHPKNTIVLPNFASPNMHTANAHPYYPLKNYDYTRCKNIDPSMINHSLTKLPPQFSPSTLAISPADSNASNETAQTHGTSQEDCGYASQSSVTSARSIESLNRMPNDVYGRYDYRYSSMVRASASTKPGPSSNQGSKLKKDIRQFISSWSEGDDENAENSARRDGAKSIPDEKFSFNKQYETVNNQEQLYVLGLVNVPSEELSKYEHIQKVSKLPENIKGYSSLELLNQFEEAIESSNITSSRPQQCTPRTVQIPMKRVLHKQDPVPRALSPLDVEAKISQSVIHKDVGCNFEIKPCSPKMLNVEVATPMQTLLNERVIEKVSNPHNVKSPIILQSVDENIENTLITETMKCPIPNTASSCKMINSQHLSESSGIDHLKTNYSLHDLESNSGVCLASLPRLDNDIELSFPEVNQQFINANKTDSVITTSFAKDLPALDVDRSATTSTEYAMNYQFSPKTETETDFSRLSKYRKLKRCVPDDNDSALAKAQATRVDSVIIKNPDNTRSTEESTDNINSGGQFRNEFQEYAMNLVSLTKHSKENHHHDVDKIFGTSTSPVVTNRHDDNSTQSHNSLAMTKHSKENHHHDVDNMFGTSPAIISRHDDNSTQSPNSLAMTKHSKENHHHDVDNMFDTSPAIISRHDDNSTQSPNSLAMTKHSKENHHHVVDNMFGTSPAVASRHDDNSTQSPNSLAINQSSNLLNKHLDVIGETSRNNIDHAQSDHFSIHSKDFSKRCVEKAVLDIPMNLSPQARYSTMGVEEETRNSTSGDKTATLDGQHESGACAGVTYVKKNEEKEQKYSSALSLDKIEDTLIKSQAVNLIDVSDSKCLDKRKEPITKATIPDNCSNSMFEKLNVVGICKDDSLISHTDKHLHVKVTSCNEERNSAFVITQKDGTKIEEKAIGKVSGGHNIFENKEVQGEGESTAVSSDTIKDSVDDLHKQHGTLKKYDRYVSKLKRKKIRGVATHRKRSFEKRSANIVDGDDKTAQNLKILLKTVEENPMRQSTHKDPHRIPNKVIAGNNIKTDSNLINKDIIGNVKIETNASNFGDMTIQFSQLQTAHADKEYMGTNDTGEHISQNCPDVIKDTNSLLGLPTKGKYLEILSEREINEIAQNKLPIDFDSDDTKESDNLKLGIETKLNLDDQVRTIPLTVSSLQANASIHFETKGQDTSAFSDGLGTKSKQIEANLENNDLGTQVLPDINAEETKTDEILNFEQKKVDDMVVSDQKQTIGRESKPLESVTFETKELGDESEKENKDTQIHEHIETRPSKNEDRYQDIVMSNTEGNPGTERSEYEIKPDFSQGVITTRSCPEKVCRPYLHKELFSSRFQNLLISNENIDILSGASEPKIADKVLNLGRKMFTTEKTVTNTVKSLTKISVGENITDLDLSQSFEPNTIDKAGTIVECNIEEADDETDAATADAESSEGRLGKETDAIAAKRSSYCNDSDVDNDFGEVTENVGNNLNENSSPQIQLVSCDDTQILTAGDSLSSCEEVFKECDNDLENYNGKSDPQLRFTNNVETDASTTNVVVIDEIISVSPEKCYESVVNNYEVSKKIQSFVQSVSDRPRVSLKRSLSDSALNTYADDVDECSEKKCYMLPKKRKKHTDMGKIDESHLLKIIQSSRRNSISTLNNENFSFCILIDDHCIVAEENYEQDNFVQIEDDLLNHPLKDPAGEEENVASPVYNLVDQNGTGQNTCMAKYDEEKAWVEDVGCEETIETEDIAENIVIGDPASPKDADLSDYESEDEDINILNNEAADHTRKVKHIYGDNMCTNDAQLVDALYRTPQMDVNKKLMDRESHMTEKNNKYYDSDSLEMLLAEPVDNFPRPTVKSNIDYFNFPNTQGPTTNSLNKENKDTTCVEVCSPVVSNLLTNVAIPIENDINAIKSRADKIPYDKTQDGTIHSCKSSLNDVFSYIHKGDGSQTISSSPEVSSTTSEEKNSNSLLKISNFKGSRISEVKSLTENKQKENNCYLEAKEYLKQNYNDGMSLNRPLRTKAAQKYIPPLRESIPDLKVKLALPQQSLLKFQKNKVAKEEPKLSTRSIYSSNNNNNKLKSEIPRRIKPKFEDVLKNIDEAQFQMHKEKNRKVKKYIPKVVIKKSENGSHYASTSTKESFNPDLTGRKWQPWVFIEKNKFIDGMALKNKTRAVFSHRRKSFVLAESFCKYKSISSAKFVISQPKINDYSTGNLKYTIKLKHSY